MQSPLGEYPPAVSLGDYTPCMAKYFFSQKKNSIKKKWFSETCTYGVNNPIRAKFFFNFFSGTFFFLALHPPAVPPGGLHPPVGRRFFFSNFFSKIIFSPQKQAHGWLFWSTGAREKTFFDFFWFRPLGDPFWTPFWTPFGSRFGPILDPLDHFVPFWSLWVTLEAINRSQMASMSLKMPKKCPQWV